MTGRLDQFAPRWPVFPRRVPFRSGSRRTRHGPLSAWVALVLGVAALRPVALTGQTGTGAVVQQGGGVQPGDLIRLKVWREPDLSGDITVDAAGQGTFPTLGPVTVTGWSADSVRRYLLSSYARYLKNPAIEITVLPRITILGAVREPGVKNVDPTLTIADALALAGGASDDGKQDHVELRRRGERVPATLSLQTRLVDTPVQSGDQLYVPQKSWLSRNTGVVFGVASLMISLVYLVRR